MKKKKKIVLWIVLGISLNAVLIALHFAPVAITLFIESNHLDFSFDSYYGYKKTTAHGTLNKIFVEEYNRSKLPNGQDHCKSFPETISSGDASMIVFSDPLFEDSLRKRGQVFLKWEMEQNSFFGEVERIKNIKGPRGVTSLKSTNAFVLPSYIFIYNCISEFEYVLVDEDSLTIFYIWFFDIESSNNALFPLEYMPKMALKKTDVKASNKFAISFSIYN